MRLSFNMYFTQAVTEWKDICYMRKAAYIISVQVQICSGNLCREKRLMKNIKKLTTLSNPLSIPDLLLSNFNNFLQCKVIPTYKINTV